MRHTLAYLIATAFITVSSTGCLIYFGDDDDDDCLWGGSGGNGAAEPAPLPGVRNPVTGQCEYHYGGGGGGGGGGGCDPTCGTCEPVPTDPAGPVPSWGYCESACSYLDEGTCLATAGCRAAYMDDFGYFECWSVDMSGPVQGGQCAGLDAWECSRHDDCVALHTNTCSNAGDPIDPNGNIACGIGAFRECAAEPDADPGLCHGQVDCNALPPGCPPNSVAGRRDGCWTGACILVEQCEPAWCEDIADEQTCKIRSDCVARYEGSDCTCDASGNCTCTTWTFTSCATAQPGDPIAPPNPGS